MSLLQGDAKFFGNAFFLRENAIFLHYFLYFSFEREQKRLAKNTKFLREMQMFHEKTNVLQENANFLGMHKFV